VAADYYVGLDLGQAVDFTALAVLERPPGTGLEPTYSLRHLRRYPLGTPYTDVVPAVVRLVGSPPLKEHVTLVVDQTGVGRAVVDLLRREADCRLVPVTITAGHQVTVAEDGSRHVPKKELVTGLQLLLQSRRLKIASSLPDADILVRELANFRVKITAAANETFGAWREGQHDDLVLAAALAAWLAEREPPWGPDAFGYGGRTEVAEAPEGVFLSGLDGGTWG
jgi:hypothetical protein